MKSENKLKNCPFCGSNDLREVKNFKIEKEHFCNEIICISCLFCGCDGPKKLYIGDSVEAWNKR